MKCPHKKLCQEIKIPCTGELPCEITLAQAYEMTAQNQGEVLTADADAARGWADFRFTVGNA